jgi:hypothetical protein
MVADRSGIRLTIVHRPALDELSVQRQVGHPAKEEPQPAQQATAAPLGATRQPAQMGRSGSGLPVRTPLRVSA